jgi:hypothetical protein
MQHSFSRMLLILSAERISAVLFFFLKFVLMVTLILLKWSLRIGLYAPELMVSIAAIGKGVGVLNTAVQYTRMKWHDILVLTALAYVAYSQLCRLYFWIHDLTRMKSLLVNTSPTNLLLLASDVKSHFLLSHNVYALSYTYTADRAAP